MGKSKEHATVHSNNLKVQLNINGNLRVTSITVTIIRDNLKFLCIAEECRYYSNAGFIKLAI